MKSITPETEYLSTRQSAKVLQVSLGTVQKMVELGELIAWKTRGGTPQDISQLTGAAVATQKKSNASKDNPKLRCYGDI